MNISQGSTPRRLAMPVAAREPWLWPAGEGGYYDAVVVPAAAREPIYAYGTIQARFPSLSVEKEFFQAADINNLLPPDQKDLYKGIYNASDLRRLNELLNARNSLYEVLTQKNKQGDWESLYIAREMCWVLQSRRGQPLYLLDTASDERVLELIQFLKVDGKGQKAPAVAVGRLQPLAGTWACNEVDAPVAGVLSLARPNPGGFCQALQLDADKCGAIVSQLLTLTDNAGRTDRERALNYALLNYPDIYGLVYRLLYGGGTDCCGHPIGGQGGYALDGVRAEPAAGGRRLVRLLFSFVGSQPGQRQLWYCVVNVANSYPFIAEALTPTLALS